MKIHIKNPSHINRINEPLSFGIPLPEGWLTNVGHLALICDHGRGLAYGSKTLASWKDGSIKWLLLDIQVSLGGGEILDIEICNNESETMTEKLSATESPVDPKAFQIQYREGRMVITSGMLETVVNMQGYFEPFRRAVYGKKEVFGPGAARIVLEDASGEHWQPFISRSFIEHDSRLRKTLFSSGRFKNDHRSHFIEFFCRTHFFCDTSFVKFEFTILNSKPAVHQGGAWDLGDEHSFFFKNLEFEFNTEAIAPEKIFYSPELAGSPIQDCEVFNVGIYQDSSGHENWQSKNHMNKDGKIPFRFKGYQVYQEGRVIASGDHAMPLMGMAGGDISVCTCVENFWQNFPKAIEVSDTSLMIRLFPRQFNDVFELQPGEQKTHTIYLEFGQGTSDHLRSPTFVDDPLIPEISCEDYYQAMTGPRPVPAGWATKNEELPHYDRILADFISEDAGYYRKNIQIDEFGWRNFGDIYADHEAVFAPEGQDFISHYNNQYDVIKGVLFQFMRTGKREWFRLAQQLADHVVDVDIYHTQEDKYQYNGGLFWHTDHHLDAHTSTHRTISRRHRRFKPEGAFGGGPYPEHNYATGLLYLYWMTGHPKYRDAVVQLSDYIVNWLEGPDTLSELTFQTIRDLAKKIKSLKGSSAPRIYVFDGPCRASGNSLNTLLDGWLLTHDARYLNHAESLITMAVHPDDDPDAMDLLNAETRWFYTVFLQALGRYLDIKSAFGQIDAAFHYGRCVLIHYAEWMLKNEYPYLEKPEILEFPNETWAAQDLRKSDIFAVASFYAGDRLRKKFEEKSHFFFEHSLKELSSFETRKFTRPMALVMSNAMPFMEMDMRNESPFDKEDMRLNSSSKKTSLLNHYLKNILKFSFKREKAWIRYQVQSILKREET